MPPISATNESFGIHAAFPKTVQKASLNRFFNSLDETLPPEPHVSLAGRQGAHVG